MDTFYKSLSKFRLYSLIIIGLIIPILQITLCSIITSYNVQTSSSFIQLLVEESVIILSMSSIYADGSFGFLCSLFVFITPAAVGEFIAGYWILTKDVPLEGTINLDVLAAVVGVIAIIVSEIKFAIIFIIFVRKSFLEPPEEKPDLNAQVVADAVN